MPRRKGHGIPPTKRAKQPDAISRSAPLKNKLYNENPPVNIKEEPLEMTVNAMPIKSEPTSIISDALHSKYLHKKFKKMASTLLEESRNNEQINNVFNGNRLKNRLSPDFVSDSEKVTSSPAHSPRSPGQAPASSPSTGRYICSYCHLICAKPSVLQKHIRAHTNERPYPCLPCGFAFKTKSNLYKHCRSRAHATKLEESGEKMPVFEGEDGGSSEDDDSISNSASLVSRTETEPYNKDEVPKSIYKPKYRFMEQPLKSPSNEKSDEIKENTISPPRLQLKIPAPNSTPSVSTPSPFTSGSSPSPEFIHRHINKLISENQAIVETNDPFWTKKFMQRTNSSDNSLSPLSTSPSPAEVKKPLKHALDIDSREDTNCDKSAPKQSKLALALLRPQSSVSPKFTNPPTTEICDAQPLNLSTNNKELNVSQLNRKRSYSEGVPERSPKLLKEKCNTVPLKIHNHSVQDFRRFTSTLSETNASVLLNHLDIRKDLLSNPQNPECSIIKDLLLKTRSAGGPSVSPSTGTVLCSSTVDATPKLLVSSSSSTKDERVYSPSSQFLCHLCKEPVNYQNSESLEIHHLYHCKGSTSSSRLLINNHSPKADSHSDIFHRKLNSKEGPMLIAPSHPSPGPLLGSTPLIESYHTKSPLAPDFGHNVLKRRKVDSGVVETRAISATTLRSLEELSKSPMRSNLQMFGGEVKIVDSSGGETKTLRIETTNRNSSKTSEIPQTIPACPNKTVIKEETDLKDPTVVTISKQSLHSGGAILQVPHKTTAGELSNRHQPSSGNSTTTQPGSQMSGYQETNKLKIPVGSNITTQNTSLSGMSASVQLPFTPFTAILSETSVINPLTNITAYNPLTLPGASMLQPGSPGVSGIPSIYSSGIVTILQGGKEIPYVPGIPGPHSLLPNSSSPICSTKLDSNMKTSKISELTFNNNQEFSWNGKVEKIQLAQSVVNKPNSLNVPMIHVNNERVVSPIDISSGSVLRKRSTDDNHYSSISCPKPTSPIKRSQMLMFSSPSTSDETGEGALEKKFLRPTSLPLKPGTFVPKRQPLTPVLSLVSPETPRPRKSFGQLYLNGHAYTYLGLKCSTRMFFCTLNKPQPIYVPLSPEHNKVSMYSNWKVCTEADPNPFKLDPGQAMALYDSRHRAVDYTVACNRTSETVTHSTYWTNRTTTTTLSSDIEESSEESAPKKVKIFDGGFESNEDYIYVRGRGRGRYVCEECGIRCKKPSMLKKHIRTHTDVRPYTCTHCKFSFKTKGNLTKHMKSKAHFKKCTNLGIVPVPTVVDESHVDQEALSRLQALRENRGCEPGESEDEEEEEEDDDETDEEDEENEHDQEGEEWQREAAAQSLLSLHETIQTATQQQQASAGLIAVRARPNTYPYSVSYISSAVSQPQTPTLTTVSAQREREKVSQNTGLAREVQGTVKAEAAEREDEEANVEEKEFAARYYFPSSRDKSGTSSLQELTVAKQATPIDLSNKPPDKSTRVCEAAVLLATLCSTMERLPITPTSPVVSENSALLQAYLTERAVQDLRLKQQYRHKSSEPVAATESAVKSLSVGVNISAAKENALGILAQTSSDARKQLSSSAEPSLQSNKPQAEFLPPSSGPSPSYVSILEDGRSMCNICNKVFSKPSQLRLHVNIHYFERPFRCESCAVSFRTKGHLQKHQRSVSHLNKVSMHSTFGTATTTNPRPFKCDDCKIAFRIHGHLAKHLRSKMHIMKLECLGKLPFGTYAELERSGINMNDIDTTDCENSLESLQLLAQKLYEKDPSKLGQWDPAEMMPHHNLSSGETSSEGEEDMLGALPPPTMREQVITGSLNPVVSPVQRLALPPIQRASLSTVPCTVEPVTFNHCPENLNHKGPKHKLTDGSEEVAQESKTEPSELSKDRRTEPYCEV